MGKNSNISQYLTRKANDIATATESLLEVTQDWQIILEFLKNRIEGIRLSKKQTEKMKRYQFAYGQASSGKFTDGEVMNLLKSEYGISQTQAYEDMRCMREIYTIVENPNKRYDLMMALQINRRLMIKCEEAGDMMVAAMFEKNRILLLKELQTEDENPAEDFKGHTFIPVFEPSLITDEVIDMKEVMKVINEKRKVKLDITKLTTTDIEHEDIEDPLQPSADT